MFIYCSTARPCPAGMIYQQCGSLCPQTCDNLDQPCEGGCAEGCFCPMGEVQIDGMCANNSECGELLTKYSYVIAPHS